MGRPAEKHMCRAAKAGRWCCWLASHQRPGLSGCERLYSFGQELAAAEGWRPWHVVPVREVRKGFECTAKYMPYKSWRQLEGGALGMPFQ